MTTQTKDSQVVMSPAQAIEILKEGNKRFVAQKQEPRNLLEQVKTTSGGQYPFAVLVSCIDSRTSSELVFDLGIGDAFNARIAGNFVNEDILGSMEFACKVAGAKLVAVIGHTKCGAVKGACDNVELGNLTSVIKNIRPAVEGVSYDGDRSSANGEFVEMVAENNVKLTIEKIRTNSPILKEMEDAGEISIVGAMYNVETGEVSFY
jgi:carbonic anhydrase